MSAFSGFQEDYGARLSATTPGSEQPSIALNLINNQKKHGMSHKTMDWLAAILFSTGSDTTAGTLTVFILAMSLYPEVQVRAQEEIDAVVGRDRLPNASDAATLPYVSAIVKETLRWRPIAPLGIPRRAAEDNWYNGYLIPRDTIVVANLWAMNRDPEIYPDYDEFRPERFTEGGAAHTVPGGDSDTSATGRDHFTFGFGRRMCPGQHVAFQTLFVDIVTLLWTLSIRPIGEPPSKSKCVDNGLVVTPAPFPCKFELRPAASALGIQLLQECADKK
ncbi:cytochrome P450 [Cylindrobasidium torrendii FP15055 ss-10]|uniref:Cytochrome P450 n=1 Tax=Cylindrobasidium torrendii FP15055 ss-10 TaxID=1314674 RepID=A0A0D7B3G7_9AGAR|nr:cytochrome P450 [Cylindrobasidium torrendii FP15055 ss-10]